MISYEKSDGPIHIPVPESFVIKEYIKLLFLEITILRNILQKIREEVMSSLTAADGLLELSEISILFENNMYYKIILNDPEPTEAIENTRLFE